MSRTLSDARIRTAARHLVRAQRTAAFSPSPVVRGLARTELSYWTMQWHRLAEPEPPPDDAPGGDCPDHGPYAGDECPKE